MDETEGERARREIREMGDRVAAQRERLAELKREGRDRGAIVSTTELVDAMERALSMLRKRTQSGSGSLR